MPSQSPHVWSQDIQQTRQRLASYQHLAVSVVATPGEDDGLDKIADDYASCAAKALDSGADLIELNFSCPNVASCDGQLYRAPSAARQIAKTVRQRVGDTPVTLKIGLLHDDQEMLALLDAVTEWVSGLVTVNCVAARVRGRDGMLFHGQARGIGGVAIHETAVDQVTRLRALADRQNAHLDIIGCGGVRTRLDVQRFLDAGAANVQLATAIMVDPRVAIAIRREAAGDGVDW